MDRGHDRTPENFPILILRDHFHWMTEKSYKKWKSLGFSDNDLANDPDTLIKNTLLSSNNEILDFNSENELLIELSRILLAKAQSIETTLIPSVNGSLKGMKSNLDKVRNKFLQALKRKEEFKKTQLSKISSQLHDNGTLAERKDSFIPMYVRSEKDYIKTLKTYSKPENKCLKIIIY